MENDVVDVKPKEKLKDKIKKRGKEIGVAVVGTATVITVAVVSNDRKRKALAWVAAAEILRFGVQKGCETMFKEKEEEEVFVKAKVS